MSSVERIIDALSSLEDDLDSLSSRVNEMKKRIISYSISEIEKQKEKVIAIANEDSREIIEAARREAEDESAVIMAETEKVTAATKRNIDNSFSQAVDFVVKTILGQTDRLPVRNARNES